MVPVEVYFLPANYNNRYLWLATIENVINKPLVVASANNNNKKKNKKTTKQVTDL